MMIVNMTLSVTLEMPDGTASVDESNGRAWLLPNGDMVKPWVVLELNELRDLSFAETQTLGIDIADRVDDVTIVEECHA
jgi:hypothetical protein